MDILEKNIEKRYSKEETGLHKLIFDRDPVVMVHNDVAFGIVDLEIEESEEILEQRINGSVTSFIFPIYVVHGSFSDLEKGTITGIIKPYVLFYNEPFVNPNKDPNFYFYLDKFYGIPMGGISTFYNKKIGKIFASIMKSEEIDLDHIEKELKVELNKNNPVLYSVCFKNDK